MAGVDRPGQLLDVAEFDVRDTTRSTEISRHEEFQEARPHVAAMRRHEVVRSVRDDGLHGDGNSPLASADEAIGVRDDTTRE